MGSRILRRGAVCSSLGCRRLFQIPSSASGVEASFAGKFRFAMQQDSNQNELEHGIETVEFKRVSDNRNILYISNIPAKFHEDELRVNTEITILSLSI